MSSVALAAIGFVWRWLVSHRLREQLAQERFKRIESEAIREKLEMEKAVSNWQKLCSESRHDIWAAIDELRKDIKILVSGISGLKSMMDTALKGDKNDWRPS
jgi:hypothetical protein